MPVFHNQQPLKLHEVRDLDRKVPGYWCSKKYRGFCAEHTPAENALAREGHNHAQDRKSAVHAEAWTQAGGR
jgi:hypothetical protein